MTTTNVTTDLDLVLHERFGLDQFRPGQRDVIESVLARRDCLCVMPTGGGKSLCYQLPSLVLDGVTLVVSPLIALMKDQVDSLAERGIRATLVNSTIAAAMQNERIAGMERGEYDLVYVAPERFRSGRFNEALTRTQIALLAVDEAHCISEWGHDFRPDYTRLGRARRRLGSPPTIALTATATDHVRRDICEQLELRDPQVFITGFDRPNLRYEVRVALSDLAKESALRELLRGGHGAGIIYCSSRKRCEEVSEFLKRDLRRKALVYHAGMQKEERRKAQDTFMNGRDLIVVATNAFGMGVDKPDIRFVVHYNMPGTVEAYYQEAGRAGRDGAESLCVLLYATGDRYIQEYFIESEYPRREIVWSIYDFLARQSDDPIELTQEQIKERLRLEISEMGVGSSLKLLESAGALERLRPRENMAIIRIDSDVSLVGLLPQTATVQRRVLSSLEQLVAATSGDDTYFSPHALTQRLGLESTQFSRSMRELCEKLPIEYVPPFRGNAVRMLDRARKLDTLGIDFDLLDERKEREYEKLDQMIRYAQSRQCRRSTILAYFGDKSLHNCGHCDNCDTSSRPEPMAQAASERVREIVRKTLSGIARATRGRIGFGKRIVAGMLAGRKIKAIKRWGLDKLTTFGLLQEFTEEEIVLLIESMIANGWVEQEEFERFRPVIRLSPAGHKVMIGEAEMSCDWSVPAALLAKLKMGDAKQPGAPPRAKTREKQSTAELEDATPQAEDLEEDRPIDRELLKRLKDVRNRWAAETNLPAYMVLSNATLEALARKRPTTIAGLLAVKGVGPAKVAKYGERLLQTIGGQSCTTRPESGGSQVRPVPHESAVSPPRGIVHSPQPATQVHFRPTPSHYWTWRLLERGFTQSECALIRDIDEDTVLEHAILAARAGHVVPLEAFLPDDLLETVWRIAEQNSNLEKPVQLPDGVTLAHVELCGLVRAAQHIK